MNKYLLYGFIILTVIIITIIVFIVKNYEDKKSKKLSYIKKNYKKTDKEKIKDLLPMVDKIPQDEIDCLFENISNFSNENFDKKLIDILSDRIYELSSETLNFINHFCFAAVTCIKEYQLENIEKNDSEIKKILSTNFNTECLFIKLKNDYNILEFLIYSKIIYDVIDDKDKLSDILKYTVIGEIYNIIKECEIKKE